MANRQGWKEGFFLRLRDLFQFSMENRSTNLTSDMRVLLNYSALLSMVYLRDHYKMFEIKTSYQYLEQLAGQTSPRVPDSHFITESGNIPATGWYFCLEISTLGEVDGVRDHTFLEENI